MSLKSVFAKAASLRDGLGGAAIAHIGCLAAPLAASALGISLTGSFMAAAMFIGAPALAVGLTYALSRLHGCSASYKKLAVSGALALSFSTILHFGGFMDHSAHQNPANSSAPLLIYDTTSICGTPPPPSSP